MQSLVDDKAGRQLTRRRSWFAARVGYTAEKIYGHYIATWYNGHVLSCVDWGAQPCPIVANFLLATSVSILDPSTTVVLLLSVPAQRSIVVQRPKTDYILLSIMPGVSIGQCKLECHFPTLVQHAGLDIYSIEALSKLASCLDLVSALAVSTAIWI